MDLIPQDVWPLIARFMDDKTKRWMRLASTKWFNIIKYDNFNFYFTRSEDIEAKTDRLATYKWPIKLDLSKSKVNPDLLIENLAKLTNLIELESAWIEDTEEEWMKLSVLTNLEICNLRGLVPSILWEKFTKLTEYLGDNLLPEEEAPVLRKMQHLTSLKFLASSKTWPFALVPCPEKLLEILMVLEVQQEHGSDSWCKLTNLTKLSVFDDLGHQYSKLSYLTTLKHLFLNNEGGSWTTPVGSNTNLTHLRIAYQNSWPLNWNDYGVSKLRNLRELILVMPMTVQELDFKFLADLPLQSLTVTNDYSSNDAEKFQTLCRYLPHTLESLELELVPDLKTLAHLTNLQKLRVFGNSYNTEHITTLSNLTYLCMAQSHPNHDLRGIDQLLQLKQLVLESVLDGFCDEYLPFISTLTNLTSLMWSLSKTVTQSKLDGFKYLTNLESLTIASGEEGNVLMNASFLAELTKLTYLAEQRQQFPIEPFFSHIRNLTNLHYLKISEVDNDNRLLDLTTLNRLTALEIGRSSADVTFTGVYFTALTSLRAIWYNGDGSNIMYKDRTLEQLMPDLLDFSYVL